MNGTLDAPCLSEGKCSVAHAYCIQEVCKCIPDYFDKDGICRELIREVLRVNYLVSYLHGQHKSVNNRHEWNYINALLLSNLTTIL